jgi:hypothetical protein
LAAIWATVAMGLSVRCRATSTLKALRRPEQSSAPGSPPSAWLAGLLRPATDDRQSRGFGSMSRDRPSGQRKMAGHAAAVGTGPERRRLGSATRHGEAAAGMELAARGPVAQ